MNPMEREGFSRARAIGHGHENTNTRRALGLVFRAFVISWLAYAGVMAQTAGDTVRTVDKGEQSNIDEAKQVVVRTEAEWTKLWQQHSPDRKRPAVDFSKDMVVGVFMGSRPTAGYNLSVVSTFAKDGNVLVQYRESQPRPGAMAAQVLTFPYHLVAVPKTAGDVKFEKIS
jgi:protease stability complex PrcB-like protein